MEAPINKEKNAWMSVPQFGGWDHKPGFTDYSMVFSRARANRKQTKKDIHHRPSMDHEKKLFASDPEDSVVRKKRILTYFNCCIKA